MEKRNYYYLVSGLPDLALEQSKLPFSIAEWLENLQTLLHPADYQLVEFIFLAVDNRNLLHLLQKKAVAWEPYGRFSRDEMEEKLKEPGHLPPYLDQFYQAFREDAPIWPNTSWENQLSTLHFDYLLANTDGFLHDWFTFESHLKNVLAAWNIREYKAPAEGQLIGRNEVTEALGKAHARDFGLAAELAWLDRLLPALESPNLLDREKAIGRLKWNFIDELNTFHYFSIDVILGYSLKLLLLNRWTQLDKEEGKRSIAQLIRTLENSFELPEKLTRT